MTSKLLPRDKPAFTLGMAIGVFLTTIVIAAVFSVAPHESCEHVHSHVADGKNHVHVCKHGTDVETDELDPVDNDELFTRAPHL